LINLPSRLIKAGLENSYEQQETARLPQVGHPCRLGGSKTIKVDVRIIAATNKNLGKEVARGRFHQDLWYRLNVYPITVPPLRQRKEDIPLLVNWSTNSAARWGRRSSGSPLPS
jgi:chemotaxis protein methyltransferase CheR